MIKKLTENSVPGSQGFVCDTPIFSVEEAVVSSATPKGIHMNQGNSAVVENKQAALQEKPNEAAQLSRDQLAENKMQADARSAELNAQLDQPASDEKKRKKTTSLRS